MRRLDLTFIALRVPIDAVTLLFAALMGYLLRHSPYFQEIKPLFQAIPFQRYLSYSLLFILCWLIIFALSGLYTTKSRRFWDELGRIIVASSAGTMVIIATIFYGQDYTASRFLVSAMWLLSIIFISVERFMIRHINYSILKKGIGHQRILVIGQSKTANDIVQLYKEKPVLGYTVIKQTKTWSEALAKELIKWKNADSIDGILLADTNLSHEDTNKLISFINEHHLIFRYLADPFSAQIKLIDVTTDGGIPIIEVKKTPLEGWGKIAKRLFDIVFSIIFIILLSPVMILTSIAIVLESRGGILFSKLPGGKPLVRIGQGGRPFHYFKFRSMKKDLHFQRYNELAAQDIRKGPLIKIKDDPRVTRVGRFIRKWSIDELPELFLVLLGRMSLVGPRPHEPEEVAKYEPHQRYVLAIKPGITGMAQISGRSDLNFNDEVRVDTWYIENWSLGLDLYILLRTPIIVLSRKGKQDNV